GFFPASPGTADTEGREARDRKIPRLPENGSTTLLDQRTSSRGRIDFAEAEAQYRHESGSDDPESMYEKRWARTVLSRALDRLRAELYESGSPDRWRRLEPFLTGNAAPGRYREIAEALEMTESGVKVAVHRSRNRYGEALRSEVSQTVNSPQDVDDEVRHLLKVVGP
ncbi:MAG: RNA polymerase sigma factor, partial [Planctomycetota bacterium]